MSSTSHDLNVTQWAIELSFVMPCLNEAETIGTCIKKAFDFLRKRSVVGEIVVADNGSTDGSQEIARSLGARVLDVPIRGYGAALHAGIASARGQYVIMGDADDSYDFSDPFRFLEELQAGNELVIGNRFGGGIEPGAMPFLNRYLGNPVLSFLGRAFFGIPVRDFHCGLRGFSRQAILDLDLRTTGMEFASEMIVRAALEGLSIAEVPTTLSADGRSRRSHLRPWRDGWRHLRFLLLYSPRWLFVYPGLFLLAFGLVGTVLLLPGPVFIGAVGIDIHTFIVACISILLGLQSLGFAIVARRFGAAYGFLPPTRSVYLKTFSLERMLLIALALLVLGLTGLAWCVETWAAIHFGPLQYASILRVLMLSLTSIAAGIQLAFTAFLSGLMDVPTQR